MKLYEFKKIASLFNVIMLVFIISMLLSACAPMTGVPSLTLMSREITQGSEKIEPVGGIVEESECTNLFLIFLLTGSDRPNQESVVSHILEKYNADVLLNAEFTTSQYGVPYIYMQFCANVKGQPARIVNGGEK